MKKTIILALSVLAICSCATKTTVTGTVSGLDKGEVIVKMLDGNSFQVLDTVKTSSDGRFSCKLDIAQGQPEFVYLFHGDTQIASLILSDGDKVSVETDTLGNYTVSGSEECTKLQGVEDAYASFVLAMDTAATPSDFAQTYVAYYRDRVKYIMSNSKSLTVIPVLYQTYNGTPVFNQVTDAIHFSNAVDSLKTVYPDSKYVKALEQQAQERQQELQFNTRVQGASTAGFPDLVMPDVNGKRAALSEVNAKAILLYFWSTQADNEKMFNIDSLLPIYNEFHDRGFEIYSVCIDADKALWAQVVKNQGLKWVNVNDGLGTDSPAISLYNIQHLPTIYMIENGDLVTTPIEGAQALRAELSRVLR